MSIDRISQLSPFNGTIANVILLKAASALVEAQYILNATVAVILNSAKLHAVRINTAFQQTT